MFDRRIAFHAWFAAGCLLGAASAFGQSGVIQGTLVDPQGAAVPNAKMLAYDEGKALVVREASTAGDGSFQLRPLLPGTYSVKAEAKGFKLFERKGLVLDPNQIMNVGSLP